jgi:hypothetical protein
MYRETLKRISNIPIPFAVKIFNMKNPPIFNSASGPGSIKKYLKIANVVQIFIRTKDKVVYLKYRSFIL